MYTFCCPKSDRINIKPFILNSERMVEAGASYFQTWHPVLPLIVFPHAFARMFSWKMNMRIKARGLSTRVKCASQDWLFLKHPEVSRNRSDVQTTLEGFLRSKDYIRITYLSLHPLWPQLEVPGI